MGYLSKVTLLCNDKMAKEVDKIIKKWTKDHDWVKPFLVEEDQANKIKKYSWDWMKWYKGPLCEPFLPGDIENLLDDVDAWEKPGYAYVFLEVGENDSVYFRNNCEGTPMEDVVVITELDLDGLSFKPEKEGVENAYVS